MKKYLYPAWAVLYVICAGLGAIPERSLALRWTLSVISLVFFVPGFWMLTEALMRKDLLQLKALRWISGTFLGLTVLALIANILSITGSVALGNVLYVILILVSVPMLCCEYWALTLFLWAGLFLATFPKMWKKIL